MGKSYQDRLSEQIEQYRETEDMQELPRVFYLWAASYVGPAAEQVFGTGDLASIFADAFATAADRNRGIPAFLSLGCGDGTTEIAVGQKLCDRGIARFRFVCCDLSEPLLERFRQKLPSHFRGRFELVKGDLNSHSFTTKFDAVMANQSLHHMLDLEAIFCNVYESLAEDGIFVANDMIGRNGHMLWPETRLLVDFFWPLLSDTQRYNAPLNRREPRYLDHDCSTVGFEGVRSQDVLPLVLAQGFHPWKFLAFGGAIDVFVARTFGPNFDVNDPDDIFLLHRIAVLNDILLDGGLIKPTSMLASFVKNAVPERCYRDRSARNSIRDPSSDPLWLANALRDFDNAAVDAEFVFGDETVRQLAAALRRSEGELASAKAALAVKTEMISAFKDSTSWRITAPLRRLAAIIQR